MNGTKEYEVLCCSCYRTVKVALINYGDGYVGVCPECKNLAYSASEKPKGGEISAEGKVS